MKTTTSASCSSLSRRALARISRTLRDGESSTKIWAEESLETPWMSLVQSFSEVNPVRSRCISTRASEQSILITSCSLDISRLKIPTVRELDNAAGGGRVKQQHVLPLA